MLFVSKCVAPPFHDGTKCLVRDVATNLERVRPHVMSHAGAPALEHVVLEPVYAQGGAWRPAFSDNLRAALWLTARARVDLWHFVFAPNPKTSHVGRALKRLRHVPVLQTVASPPRSFEHAPSLLFGDVVVTQSRWTRERLLESFAARGSPAPPIETILPPVGAIEPRSPERVLALRHELGIPQSAPVYIYPGDLETSRGAETVQRAVAGIASSVPGAIVVFAYRPKSPRAHEIAERLAHGVSREHARFVSTLPDVLTLVQTSNAVLFPVDDLWGKVDLPIVLLEAMVLGVPVLVLDRGPLAELGGVLKLQEQSPDALVAAVAALHANPDKSGRVRDAQRAFIEERCSARVVSKSYEALYLDLLT